MTNTHKHLAQFFTKGGHFRLNRLPFIHKTARLRRLYYESTALTFTSRGMVARSTVYGTPCKLNEEGAL